MAYIFFQFSLCSDTTSNSGLNKQWELLPLIMHSLNFVLIQLHTLYTVSPCKTSLIIWLHFVLSTLYTVSPCKTSLIIWRYISFFQRCTQYPHVRHLWLSDYISFFRLVQYPHVRHLWLSDVTFCSFNVVHSIPM